MGLCFSSCEMRTTIEAPGLGCCENSAGHICNRHSVIIRLQVTPALDWKRFFCSGCSLRSRLLGYDWVGGGSVKLKSEGKSLITAGLPLNMNYPFPSSLTTTLGEIKKGQESSWPPGAWNNGCTFCSRLHCAPHSLKEPAV